MGGFTCLFADRRVLFLWDDCLIRSPEIREAMASTVRCWNGLPQGATGALAAVSNSIGHHLTALAAQGNPDPDLIGLFANKRPQIIQFQDGCLGVRSIRWDHCLAQWGKLSDFFFRRGKSSVGMCVVN